MLREILLRFLSLHTRLAHQEDALKTAFSKVKAETTTFSEHLVHFNRRLSELEKQCQRMAKDIAELQKRVDVVALKESLKEELRRELNRNSGEKKTG